MTSTLRVRSVNVMVVALYALKVLGGFVFFFTEHQALWPDVLD